MPAPRAADGAGKGAACAGVPPSRSRLLLRPAGSLEDRIAAGEFTDAGSTKERLTRPLRRILAKDPIGPGAWVVCSCMVQASVARYQQGAAPLPAACSAPMCSALL